MVTQKFKERCIHPGRLITYLDGLYGKKYRVEMRDDTWYITTPRGFNLVCILPIYLAGACPIAMPANPTRQKHFLGDGWRAKKRHASSNYKKESGQELKIKEKICQEINSKLKGLREKGEKGHGEEVKDEVKGEETKGEEAKGEEAKGEEAKGQEAKGQEAKGQEAKGIEDAEAINTHKGEGEK
ncbi:hypothetical protein NPX13_g6387 [Xylaria arbuscula]|uniref:Uncharacterized protein n=1 Tax=Xylaria arbuscula TaxID=114810 RepID=A0A9W8NCZ1_9PEZI|nr:hypothetical protein NPX13_g6387 [Xylaria arbuscula]